MPTKPFIILGFTLSFVFLFFVFSAAPKEWEEIDYAQVELNDLKNSISGFAGDDAFKTGYGWIAKNYIFENRLRMVLGTNVNAPSVQNISLVFAEKWIVVPFLGSLRFHNRRIYRREGFDLI